MASETKYYLDDKNRLWKKTAFQEFYFSRKTQNWIESKIDFISLAWDNNYQITKQEAKKICSLWKEEELWEEEEIPFRYFGNDNDVVFAEDILGNQFYVLADMTLLPAPQGTVDCMWGGLTEEQARILVEKEYKEEKWILLAKGRQLKRFIGDYIGEIYLSNENEDTTILQNKYESRIIHDDGIEIPAYVKFFETNSLEELKKKTENEMKKRSGIEE